MHISALPFFANYAPANSQAQDIDPLALSVGILPQLSTWFVPIQQLSQPDPPPFPKVASYWLEFIAPWLRPQVV